jgi:hypothetical protein
MISLPQNAIRCLLEAVGKSNDRALSYDCAIIASWLEDVIDPPLPDFEDQRVQAVYEILCDTDLDGNPREEHWEGWQARRIASTLQNQQRSQLQSERDELLSVLLAVQDNDQRGFLYNGSGTDPIKLLVDRTISKYTSK